MWDPTDRTAVLRMTPSRPRVFVGTGALLGVAGLVVWIALNGTFSPSVRVLQLGAALGFAYMAARLYRAGEIELEFTEDSLRERASGRVLASLDQIKSVDRGAFAFKPSNGFLVVLKEGGAPRAWEPGVWWRISGYVGVGGVIPSHQSRLVAETIQLRLKDPSL